MDPIFQYLAWKILGTICLLIVHPMAHLYWKFQISTQKWAIKCIFFQNGPNISNFSVKNFWHYLFFNCTLHAPSILKISHLYPKMKKYFFFYQNRPNIYIFIKKNSWHSLFFNCTPNDPSILKISDFYLKMTE